MRRMLVAPPGCLAIVFLFIRTARGANTTHELNREHGEFQHGDGWGAVYQQGSKVKVYRSMP